MGRSSQRKDWASQSAPSTCPVRRGATAKRFGVGSQNRKNMGIERERDIDYKYIIKYILLYKTCIKMIKHEYEVNLWLATEDTSIMHICCSSIRLRLRDSCGPFSGDVRPKVSRPWTDQPTTGAGRRRAHGSCCLALPCSYASPMAMA